MRRPRESHVPVVSVKLLVDGPRFRNILPIEFEVRVPLGLHEVIVLSPGRVNCDVTVSVVAVPEAEFDTSDAVDLILRIADRDGRVYISQRRWTANRLLLPALSRNRRASSSAQVIARGVRLFDDSRNNLPTLAYIDGVGPFVFAYRAKYLYLTCDLYKEDGIRLANGEQTADRLIVRLHAAHHGGLPFGPTPPVEVSCDGLAKMVLCPALVNNTPYPAEPPVFQASNEVAEPQPLVRRELAHAAK